MDSQTQRSTAQYSQGYSRFIRRARLVLPVIALILIAIVLSWPGMDRGRDVIIQEVPDTADAARASNELINPRFESVDEDEQPFTILAQRAIQSGNDENLVLLDKPSGDMTLRSGQWIAVEAEKGAYKQIEKQLLLQDNVNIFHDQGYQLQTPQLHLDFAANMAWSDQQVRASGPQGVIEASGLQASGSENRVIFTGPATLTITRTEQSFTLPEVTE